MCFNTTVRGGFELGESINRAKKIQVHLERILDLSVHKNIDVFEKINAFELQHSLACLYIIMILLKNKTCQKYTTF